MRATDHRELTAWMAQQQMTEALDPVIDSLANRMRADGQELYERAEKIMENSEANVDLLHAIYAEDCRDLVTEIMATRGGLSFHATRALVAANKALDNRMELFKRVKDTATREAIWLSERDLGHRTEHDWVNRSGAVRN